MAAKALLKFWAGRDVGRGKPVPPAHGGRPGLTRFALENIDVRDAGLVERNRN